MARSALKTSSDVSKLLREARSLIRGCNTPGRKTGAHLKRELARDEVTR